MSALRLLAMGMPDPFHSHMVPEIQHKNSDDARRADGWMEGRAGMDGLGQLSTSGNGTGIRQCSDAWSLLEPLLGHWWRILAAGVVLALAALALAVWKWRTTYTASAQLIRHESPNAEEVFRPRQVSPQTFVLLLESQELAKRAASQLHPPRLPADLAARVRVAAERGSDLLTVTATDTSPEAALELANLYAAEAVRFTQELQAKTAAEVEDYLGKQLADVETGLRKLNEQWLALPAADSPAAVSPAAVMWRPSRLMDRRQAAREELADLLTRYTDVHPLVQQQRAKLTAIDRQLDVKEPAAAGEPTPADMVNATKPAPTVSAPADPEVLRSQLQSLESTRLSLAGRRRAAQLFESNPAGYYRMFAPASPGSLARNGTGMKIAAFTLFGGLTGTLAMALLVIWRELNDPYLRTARDVTHVTGLPIVAEMGDLRRLDASSRARAAFKAWTALQNRLSESPNRGLICGVTSSGHGEGRSTWVQLLAEAAHQRGFRVLTVATRPSPMPGPGSGGAQDGCAGDAFPLSTALTTNVLAAPAEVTERLTGSDPPPLVHIPLPGWVWNLERRLQWQAALRNWASIDNLVILVELPPASVPESILLAENLPNLIWLTDSGSANAIQTREELQILRLARCHLVGAVLNREPPSLWKNWFPRWLGSLQPQAA